MNIANPIYDTVFRFLMDDMEIAKVFISAIIGEKVLELEFAPQEYVRFIDEDDNKDEDEKEKKKGGTNRTVYRLDFAAKIETPTGHKTVMIEVQKAKLPTDIIRFRQYLGKHYSNRNNTYDKKRLKARQIYCIFFLGYDIGIPGRPVLCVDQKIIDVATSEILDTLTANEFIYGLHHRSWIVQIKQLKNRRRNTVEQVLSVFDQKYRTQDDHIMNIKEDEYPEEFHPIIRRLQMAGENAALRQKMEEEDYFWEDVREKEREIGAEREEKNKALKVIEEKNKVIDEMAKEKEKMAKEKEEKDKALEAMAKEMAELKKQLAQKKD